MTGSLAHTGAHAGEHAVDWSPDQVESGAEAGGGSSAAGVLARGLGLFSLGLGVAQVLAPQRVVSMVGAPVTQTSLLVTRVMGVREIAHGLGVITSSRPAPWLWTRVAGDAIDMGLLGRSMNAAGAKPARVAGAMAAVAGTAAADLYDSVSLSRSDETVGTTPMRVKAAVTINRSADDLYRYWSNYENLPDFMTHLKSVEWLDDGRSKWTVRAPLGSSASWEAETVEDVAGEVIRWQSLPGSQIVNEGEVRFKPAPGDRGTEVHVLLRYESPVGSIGSALLKLFGDEPVQQVKDDLRRFKQVMETGQVVRSDGAPYGSDARMQPKQRPAQPAGD